VKYFVLWIAMVTGNLIYQLITTNYDWNAAIERSIFQGVAVAATVFIGSR